jgi:hypothetical protein
MRSGDSIERSGSPKLCDPQTDERFDSTIRGFSLLVLPGLSWGSESASPASVKIFQRTVANRQPPIGKGKINVAQLELVGYLQLGHSERA